VCRCGTAQVTASCCRCADAPVTYKSCTNHVLSRPSTFHPTPAPACPCLPPADAYGLVLGHGQGWSLVYSGDTQPSQQLVAAGRGCTLLIHEATFEPCLAQQARLKRHSTTAEALDVARVGEGVR
jgi:hypothetical protein